MTLKELLLEILRIPSPTFKEQIITGFLREYIAEHQPDLECLEYRDSFIYMGEQDPEKPTIAFVGHSDVVPKHFEPYEVDEMIFGAGASDMKGGVAALLYLFLSDYEALCENFNPMFILYAREEGTGLEENGLYGLIHEYTEVFETIDLAIVGEPTNNAIQLGCVGSLHAKVTILGKEAHSARPWDGFNALYKAVPFIQGLSQLKPQEQTIAGLKFYDVISITESQTDSGRTTVPGLWECNVNFRFSPIYSPANAEAHLLKVLSDFGVRPEQVSIVSSVPAGNVIESDVFLQFKERCQVPVEAKQAWTDVAQLTALGIPSLNYGPGLTSQAHKPNEYIVWKDVDDYYQNLKRVLTE